MTTRFSARLDPGHRPHVTHNPAYDPPFVIGAESTSDGQVVVRLACDLEFVQALYDQLGMVLQEAERGSGDRPRSVLRAIAQAASHQHTRDRLELFRFSRTPGILSW